MEMLEGDAANSSVRRETLGHHVLFAGPIEVCMAVAPKALDAARAIPAGSGAFSVLLIGKFHDETEEALKAAAIELVDRGVCAFSVCGPDSERVHDAFDAVAWGREPRTIMSIWHAWPEWQEALESHLDATPLPDEAWYEHWNAQWILVGEAESPVTPARIRAAALVLLGAGP